MPGGDNPGWDKSYSSTVSDIPGLNGTMTLGRPQNGGQPTVGYSAGGSTLPVTSPNYTASTKSLSFTVQYNNKNYDFGGTWSPSQGPNGGFSGSCSQQGPGQGNGDWTADCGG